MPATAEKTTARYDIDGFLKLIGDVPVTTDMQRVRLRSRDYFWYSPVLNKQLHGKTADIVATPRNEADVIAVAAACAKLRIPLTPRGAATGNYGQAVPLEGGVLLDLTAMTKIEWQKPGIVRCEPGIKMNDLDAATRPNGWELRMHPSTKRMATIGGFVGGGSGGIGSINYGGLREPGNILAARVVTVEETPRAIELRTDAAQKVNRAYGTTGIITALEMPLAPAWPWIDVIVTFDDFADAVQVGLRGRARRRRGEEADYADDLADPAAFPGAEGALPGRQACPLRDDRRTVDRELPRDHREARHHHAGAAAR